MSTAKSTLVMQSDFCRMAVRRMLACMALAALLVLHPEQESLASDLCLKCLEDVAHNVGLTSQAVQLLPLRIDALQSRSQRICRFATPVASANQRGPPQFLS